MTFLFLGGCSVVPSPAPTNPPGESPSPLAGRIPDSSPPPDELLVEDLVSEADTLGNFDIGGISKILSWEAAEKNLHDQNVEMLPMTPTIPMTANRVVERAMNDYLQNRRAVLSLWMERSATYFPMIERIFAEEGVPDELKYIALNESGLRATARSGMGAAGMWQFMPATGRGSGLRIDDWVDERLDPEKSTRAAARHFKVLYEAYNQNWHLALAGYNCSYRCISRAVRRAGGSIQDPPSFWEIYPYLPQETREFVPKFIAAALIISNPDMFGVSAETYGREMAYDVVEVKGMLNLEDAARFAGTTLATLRGLNPSLRKLSLPDGEEPFPLKIPYGSYDLFVTAFNSLPPSAKVAPKEYVVKRGDTLDAIARSLKVSVAAIQEANGIRGHLIYPDQKLLVPGAGVSTTVSIVNQQRLAVAYGETRNRPIQLREEFQLVEQTTGDKVLMAVSLNLGEEAETVVPTVYKVRSGDTLSQISERFKVAVRDIQQWNNLRGSLIRAGQELTLHTRASAAADTTYRVQRGDNLGGIARRFGVSVDNLKNLNGLDSDLIYPGQDLQIN